MRKIILLASALTMATATPVIGQTSPDTITSQLVSLQSSITLALQSGQITSTVAETLRSQLRQITQLQQQLNLDGLTQIEITRLTRQIERLQQRVQQAVNTGGNNQNFCPPGLAKKTPPCIPPGQAKKTGTQ